MLFSVKTRRPFLTMLVSDPSDVFQNKIVKSKKNSEFLNFFGDLCSAKIWSFWSFFVTYSQNYKLYAISCSAPLHSNNLKT
jgi:hypothetical protein